MQRGQPLILISLDKIETLVTLEIAKTSPAQLMLIFVINAPKLAEKTLQFWWKIGGNITMSELGPKHSKLSHLKGNFKRHNYLQIIFLIISKHAKAFPILICATCFKIHSFECFEYLWISNQRWTEIKMSDNLFNVYRYTTVCHPFFKVRLINNHQ